MRTKTQFLITFIKCKQSQIHISVVVTAHQKIENKSLNFISQSMLQPNHVNKVTELSLVHAAPVRLSIRDRVVACVRLNDKSYGINVPNRSLFVLRCATYCMQHGYPIPHWDFQFDPRCLTRHESADHFTERRSRLWRPTGVRIGTPDPGRTDANYDGEIIASEAI